MPFGSIFTPSMGLSLLKGSLNRAGIPSRILYFTLPFARRIGRSFYDRLGEDGTPGIRELAGEWIFSGALFGDTAAARSAYVTDVLTNRRGWVTRRREEPVPRAIVNRILDARDQVDGFLDECVDQITKLEPRLVGFTSVFQQQVASLALASRVRRALPDATIILGGGNCEGVMGSEVARRFPFLDAVFSGEADLVFPDIVRRALASEPLSGIPGLKTASDAEREFETGRFSNAPAVRNMDDLPRADFDDYFEQFNATRYRRYWAPRVFFETSRGCWWGEKQHCTFCGLNGLTMAYRSKSWQRALEELTDLVERYPGSDIQVVDNILDMRYFNDLLPAIEARGLKTELFFETKSNLRKDQLRILKRASVTDIQPGIESFSDAVLALMRKGVTGLQNVQLLKWCLEIGVTPHWNLLWGFPGEPAADYAWTAGLMPLISHLRPPTFCGGIRLDRFSPNFTQAEMLGFTDVAPLSAYRYVYALPDEAVANIAYHFSFNYREPRDVDGYMQPVRAALRRWRRASGGSALFLADTGEHLVITDLRPVARALVTTLSGLDRRLYLACDAATDARRLAEIASGTPNASAVDSIEDRLAGMVQRGLMIRSGHRYLALAVRLGEHTPSTQIANRFWGAAAGIGRVVGDAVELPLHSAGGDIWETAPARGSLRNVGPDRRVATLTPDSFSVDAQRMVVVRNGEHAFEERQGAHDGEESL
jgi:ribosomal peptide maturation radical SAM protein 1